MSSFVGIGVGETVVLMAAVETGPTKRSQRSATLRVMADVNAVGFETADPLTVVEGGNVVAIASEPVAVPLTLYVGNSEIVAVLMGLAVL